MTRTWTLVDDETVLGYPIGPGTVNSDYDKFYFHTGSGRKVYEWDGSTLTDIAGTYFTDGDWPGGALYGVVWFKGNLYALHNCVDSFACRYMYDVSVWNGGTSWSKVRQIVDNAGRTPNGTMTDGRSIACDDNIMVVSAPGQLGYPYSAVNSTPDGSSWTVDTWQSAYNDFCDFFYGWPASRYSEVIGFEDDGDVLATRVGTNWAEVSPGLSTGHYLLGHDGTNLFYRDSTPPYTIYKTDDWNATQSALPSTFSPSPIHIFNVGSDAVMMYLLNHATAYTWDGSDFVADGTASGWIRSFFRFGTTMYLMASSSDRVRFYSGGTITLFDDGEVELTGVAKLYWGLNSFTDNKNIVVV